ncbi:UNVERIFIED_ORG: putative esterase [Methylobacterium sp. SuP10 SLI 274]|uniref:alpha/beta hydrolase family protein n=1 Tax=Methylorubrum extorquens TaxID=408 RepID=UPI001477E722|nr:hypothetical protein [Methylorubrum extorquens]MDF9861151.1 putative esterase [Methylorubrum pseudosasae]MDH6640019.1 putative esterase [Methylobacterium sp. SuP10 SLI 274]MDH6669224.1 putative esterase [Methylorubrum zatmanii]MCP1556763.1 putative esterase [Methylorubrum extorquens]MDF9789353.1 putative esterase [Methylorubrum extorquens]
MFLSHGTRDAMWSVAMTQRLEARLLQAGRTPEVHLLAGQDHSPHGEDENEHHLRLITFLRRTLEAA